MLRRGYDWIMGLAGHRHALGWLAALSFIESSFFPVPPDLLLIALVMADRRRAWVIAGVCTAASVAGGFLGYAIGSVFYDTAGQWIIHTYHLETQAQYYTELFRAHAIQIMMVKGLIPIIPYKLITITAGLAKMDLLTFGLTSLAVRSMRFFLVAGLLWKYGAPIQQFVEKRLALVTTSFALALVGGFLIIKLV